MMPVIIKYPMASPQILGERKVSETVAIGRTVLARISLSIPPKLRLLFPATKGIPPAASEGAGGESHWMCSTSVLDVKGLCAGSLVTRKYQSTEKMTPGTAQI